LIATRKLVDDE